jgi:pimeloyl-ACP methyl ester carboxylesterase
LFLRDKILGSSKLLMYFHGNAEDVGLSYRELDILKKSLKINILAMEYPGYGVYEDPDGCSAKKIKEDCDYVYRYVLQETGIKESDVIIFGRSIGTGPAIYLASKHKPGALCLMSAYTSIRDIAVSIVPVLGYLMSTHFENSKLISNVSCPAFFVHGRSDTLIPFQHSVTLHERCVGAPHKQINLPDHMTHNDFDYEYDIIMPISTFLE